MLSVRPLAAALLSVVFGLQAGVETPPGPESAQHLATDADLEQSLRNVVDDLHLSTAVREKRLAVSLVDVTDVQRFRYAGVNDHQMMYAASLPKVAALVAG